MLVAAIEGWRYATIAAGSLALGTAFAVLGQRWRTRWRWAQVGIILIILGSILPSLQRLSARPLVGNFVVIVASLLYVGGHLWGCHWRPDDRDE